MVATVRDGDPLEPTNHLWPDPDDGPWRLVLLWSYLDGRPECTGLEVRLAEKPDRGGWSRRHVLPTSGLREIRFAELIAADRAAMTPASSRPTNLRRSTLERLEEAAQVYQDARAKGYPPVPAVAEHFHISKGGASNLVARARAAGLLPPTSPGVAYG